MTHDLGKIYWYASRLHNFPTDPIPDVPQFTDISVDVDLALRAFTYISTYRQALALMYAQIWIIIDQTQG